MRHTWSVTFVLFVIPTLRADGPADNIPDKVRRIPPPGVQIPDADRKELERGVAELGREIEGLKTALKGKPALLELLPDVQIYHKAIDWALRYDEFFNQKNPAADVKTARGLVATGMERARDLQEGKSPWTTATGLVVRGYISKIDGSVQPYGLVVPPTYKPDYPHRYRLDIWCHGRGETLSELSFIQQRQSSPGEFTPPNAFVLHPYGRYCNANKLAGEVDVLEALEHVQKHYAIDDDRIVMRGFSMGGAACWQFAVHYPDKWCAAAPGAGFSETQDFLKVFQNESIQPSEYEQKLWHLYDCTDYALNLFDLPTVAYSGEIDKQKQAADMMAKALKMEGMELTHIIGPKTAHTYHPEAKKEINRRIDLIAAQGRKPVPKSVKFSTYTLRYNHSFWITIDEMAEHWQEARVEAEIRDKETIFIEAKAVRALTISMPPGSCPLDLLAPPVIIFGDGQKTGTFAQTKPQSDRSWVTHWRRTNRSNNEPWEEIIAPEQEKELRKRHGLQGPIDDAFMDRFLMVRPTGTPLNEKVGKWADAEMKHAIEHWRRQFRGDAPIKDDTDVTAGDIAESNLVLWGDPSSNAVLKKIASDLPITWDAGHVRLFELYDAGHHVPVFIYPNPLNPKKYVVVNSGFTFREYDYLNNARQVPKLPDWAIIDIDSPVTSRAPGKVVNAGFCNEHWQVTVRK
jgi:Prolyl oligopeptidase family